MTLRTLLLSRDTEAIRTLRMVLPKLGIGLDLVQTIATARELLGRNKFEGVIVDCDDLEGGLDLIKNFRGETFGKTCIIFAVTNRRTNMQAAFSMGASFVLEKPLSIDRATRCFRAAHGLLVLERRRCYRHKVDISITLDTGKGSAVTASIVNLSYGGAGLQFSKPVSQGDQFDFRFLLPETGDPITGKAEMIWSNAEGRGGLRFVQLEKKARLQMEKWLSARMEQIQPIASTPTPVAAVASAGM